MIVREAREPIAVVRPVVAVHPTDRHAEAHPVEIATAREWTERAIPPEWWMD